MAKLPRANAVLEEELRSKEEVKEAHRKQRRRIEAPEDERAAKKQTDAEAMAKLRRANAALEEELRRSKEEVKEARTAQAVLSARLAAAQEEAVRSIREDERG